MPFSFGIDDNGNYGYKKEGADTVIPFKKLEIQKVFTGNSFSNHTIDLSSYEGYEKFSADNFFLGNVSIGRTSTLTGSVTKNIIDSYNQDTGILSLNASVMSSDGKMMHYINYTVYLIH